MIRLLAICFLLSAPWSLAGPSAMAGNGLKICIDENYWYPYTFLKGAEASGIHIDIVSRALRDLGFSAEISALPWKRCLKYADLGLVDAVATASYTEERAAYLFYPDKALAQDRSHWRVMQVEYVVVTLKSERYEFNGDVQTLPQPVYVPSGYSVANQLRDAGVRVDDQAKTDKQNLEKLIRWQRGAMVAIPSVAFKLIENAEFGSRLHLGERTLFSKPYYLAFSRKTKFTQAERRKVWNGIAAVRQNEGLMREILGRYE